MVSHDHKSAHFQAHIRLAVRVGAGMVRDILEVLEVAFDHLPRLVLLFGLAEMCAPELEPVAVRFGLVQFLCPTLSGEGTALEATEILFCEPREAMVMLLAEH